MLPIGVYLMYADELDAAVARQQQTTSDKQQTAPVRSGGPASPSRARARAEAATRLRGA